MKDLMIDIETLGRNDDTVIAAISCVAFDAEHKPYETKEERDAHYEELVLSGFFVKLDVPSQVLAKRNIHESVVNFWKQQPREAQEYSVLPSPNDVNYKEAAKLFEDYLKEVGYDPKAKCFVWARRCHYDFPKLDHLWVRTIGRELPISYFQFRDTVTFFDILRGTTNGRFNSKFGNPKSFVAHHALHDCALEITKMIECINT